MKTTNLFPKAWKICVISFCQAQLQYASQIIPTWEGEGAYLAPPPLTFLFVASKRMYMSVWNFLTFLIYQKPKFEGEKIRFFYPTPPQRGVVKKWKFWKVVGEPKLQNMIFKAHKNKAKSKR